MKKIFSSLFFVVLAIIPTLAFAEAFTPPPDDISIKILNQLFGGLFSGGNDIFGEGIAVFNGAILTIGGILATYTILAGVIGTAHDGEMLGKKFSSVWIPIRYSVGTAVVLPVLPGGYCVMSKIVALCITFGVGLAGNVWSGYMEHPTQSANVSYPPSGREAIITLAKNAFTASACVAGYQKFIDQSDDALGFKSLYTFKKSVDSLGNYNYGYVGGGISPHVCGFVSMPAEKAKNVDSKVPDHSADVLGHTFTTNPVSTNPGYLGPLDNIFKPVDITPINAASATETSKLVEAMDALAIQAVSDTDIKNNASAYYKKIEAAADVYISGMQTAARSLPQPSATKDQQYGWILAGAYFNNIVLSNDALHKAMASSPHSQGSINLVFNNIPNADMADYLVANQVINAAPSSILSGHSDSKSETSGNGDSGFGISAWLGSKIAWLVTKVDLVELKNDDRHPVIIINEMGVRIIESWTGIMAITTAAAVSTAAADAESKTLVGQATTLGGLVPVTAGTAGMLNGLNIILSFIMVPLTALLVVGFTCAYLIPMIPFIMWLGCIGGWVIQCVIALIAAPLWAIMHLHPNGDDLTGKGGNGYSMLMGLLLRPALLVFGFIASIAVSSVMGEFINKIYFQVFAFSGENVDGWLAFFTMLAGTIIYAVIMFSFIKKTHSIMHVIPDELLKWVGGGGDSLGNYASSMGEGAERGGASAAAQLGTGGVLGAGIGKAMNELKNNSNQTRVNQALEQKMQREVSSPKDNLNPPQDTSFNDSFGHDASNKKEMALGFSSPSPNSFREQEQSAKYNESMQSVKDSHGEAGVEQFQNAMINSSKNEHAGHGFSATTAMANIASNIIVPLTNAASEMVGQAAEAAESVPITPVVKTAPKAPPTIKTTNVE